MTCICIQYYNVAEPQQYNETVSLPLWPRVSLASLQGSLEESIQQLETDLQQLREGSRGREEERADHSPEAGLGGPLVLDIPPITVPVSILYYHNIYGCDFI